MFLGKACDGLYRLLDLLLLVETPQGFQKTTFYLCKVDLGKLSSGCVKYLESRYEVQPVKFACRFLYT